MQTQIAPPRDLPVLVVEDELLIAMHLEDLLARRGWRVLGPAASVGEALRLLAREVPAVALLDVNLGGELVVPVAEALRARGVPFVVASAHDRLDVAVPPLAEAPNVGKPTDEASLLAALERAVDA